MEVKNCKGCGMLFNFIGGVPLCANCQKDLEKKYEQVKDYIYDNPRASMQMVAEENDVSVPQLKKWVREERLEFTSDSAVCIDCENCGKPIRTGRFCNLCKDKMTSKLGGLYQEKKPEAKKANRSTESKMRFLDNQK